MPFMGIGSRCDSEAQKPESIEKERNPMSTAPRVRYYWAPIAGSDTLHAWKDRRAESETYCGRHQLRSKAKPAEDAKRCEHCAEIVERIEKARMRDNEQARARRAEAKKTRESERRKVSTVLEAIRPASVDPEKWREAAKKLVRMV